uniref:Ig-like domain-containing protein n=1 Tax=Maylandia zebra TaxID=106582 RepID=A0A3P9ASD9_9CICH
MVLVCGTACRNRLKTHLFNLFRDEDVTLTIINITRYDQGPFMCYVFNNFSNDISNLVKLSISCELSCLLYSFLNFFSLNYNYYKTLSFFSFMQFFTSPENIILRTSPSGEYYEEGLNIRLTCWAISRPSALFYWFLNGVKLIHTGPQLRLIVKQIHSELYKKSVQNDLYSFPTKVSLNVSADVVFNINTESSF